MGSHIYNKLEKVLESKEILTDKHIDEIKEWQSASKRRLERLKSDEDMKDLFDHGEAISRSYHVSRVKKNAFIPEHPTYVINVTESDVRIEIQREFDIGREGEILSHPTLSPTELLHLRRGTGRTFYESCNFIPPELSVDAEIKTVRSAGGMINGQRQWEWLPESIAELVGVGRDGRPLDGVDPWKFYFKICGYQLIEDARGSRGMPSNSENFRDPSASQSQSQQENASQDPRSARNLTEFVTGHAASQPEIQNSLPDMPAPADAPARVELTSAEPSPLPRHYQQL